MKKSEHLNLSYTDLPSLKQTDISEPPFIGEEIVKWEQHKNYKRHFATHMWPNLFIAFHQWEEKLSQFSTQWAHAIKLMRQKPEANYAIYRTLKINPATLGLNPCAGLDDLPFYNYGEVARALMEKYPQLAKIKIGDIRPLTTDPISLIKIWGYRILTHHYWWQTYHDTGQHWTVDLGQAVPGLPETIHLSDDLILKLESHREYSPMVSS